MKMVYQGFVLEVKPSDRNKKIIKLNVEVFLDTKKCFVILKTGKLIVGTGSSFFNPEDEYNELQGIRTALKRASSAACFFFIEKKLHGFKDVLYAPFVCRAIDKKKQFVHSVDGSFRKFYKNNLLLNSSLQ